GGLDRVVGQAQGACEDVRGAAGHHRQTGQAVQCRTRVQETVDDLVDRAVAAEGHHEVDVLAVRRLPAEVARVAAVLGGDRLQLHLARQRVDQHVTSACACGGCPRVDHEKCTHAGQRTYWGVPGPDRGRDPVRGGGVSLATPGSVAAEPP